MQFPCSIAEVGLMSKTAVRMLTLPILANDARDLLVDFEVG